MIQEPAKSPFNLGSFEANLDAHLEKVMSDPEYVAEMTAERQGNPVTLGPPVISAEEWAEKQIKNSAAAAETWHRNVQRPRREPIQAAIAATAKRKEAVIKSLEEGKWEKSMAKVDEAVMYEVIRQTGPEGYRRGVQARAAKVKARVVELQPLVTAVKLEVEQLPDVTEADREARMIANLRGMRAIGKKRRGI